MKIKEYVTGVMAAVLLAIPAVSVKASDGEEFITITVQASDDNEGITYAIDSDDPDSFGPSNTFTTVSGTPHTIYVKDAAGNITSQVYEPEPPESPESDPHSDEDTEMPDGDDGNGQTIDIELELKKESEDGKPYEIKRDTPAEQGGGTVYSKTFLDGTDTSEQVFYSMTTAEGDVFYLLVDQGQESNNVYLLSQVSSQDLAALAADGGSMVPASQSSGDEDSLLKALSASASSGGEENSTRRPAARGGVNKNSVILLLLMAAGGGFYYYQKVYKAKKEQEMDAMEAPDMDQFSSAADEDEDMDFDYGDDGDKEQYINDLMAEDEAEYAAAAENDAAEMGWDNIMEDNEEDIFSDTDPGGIYDSDDFEEDEEE